MAHLLQGITVLDLSRALPGPFCTQLLGDYGAEVIKIEDRTGDTARNTEPHIAETGARFYSVNRNKKSLTLDLRKPDGKAIFKKLAAKSDVVVDAFRPGTMDKLGLGYEALSKINPGIVYCGLNAFGSSGPWRHTPAHDINVSSLAGVTFLTGDEEAPAMSPLQTAGLGGALFAAIAILMALYKKKITGLGQYCDVSMLDSSISLLAYILADWSGTGCLPKRGRGRLTGGFAYFNIYETADHKYISLGVAEEKYWTKFCRIINKPNYIEIHKKPEMQDEMVTEIRKIIKQKTRDEWNQILGGEELCYAPVLSLDEVSEHPQVLERQMMVRLDNFLDSGKGMYLTGLPIKFSENPGELTLEFPELGQHNRDILSGLGYTDKEIDLFKSTEVI
ncbi:MAG: CoA transferase [Syntrophomonas sp.]